MLFLNRLKRSLCAALLAMMVFPPMAFADESQSGDGVASAEREAVEVTPADATNQSEIEHEQQDDDGVIVSATAEDALIEGMDYGITNFTRASAGSNKSIDGVYHGYNFYVGTEGENLSCVVLDGEMAVIHVPESVLTRFSIDIDDPSSQDVLKRYLIALDGENAKGAGRLEAVTDFYFTSSDDYVKDGIRFQFDKEIKDGYFYICIIGVDETDITAVSSPNSTKISFADFGKIAPADEIDIVLPATGLAWFAEFLGSIDMSPLFVTLKTTLTAIVIIFILGLAAAYLTMRVSKRVQDVLDTIFTIPMVLPPTVCGFILLLACGNNTAFGRFFIDIGFPLIFSWPATVIAAVVVAFPLMYRNSRGAFENLDPNMLDAARTLGWSNFKIFFRLMLPLSWSSIAAATVLAFARALGEFGATLFLAGNYVGITRTIPIAIYFEWMNGNTDVAIFWTIVVIIFSFIVILFINLWSRHQTKYRRTHVE